MEESKMATINIRIFIYFQVVEPWDLTKMCDKLKRMHMGFVCPIVYTKENTFSFHSPKKGISHNPT